MRPDTPADPDDPAAPTTDEGRVGELVARLADPTQPASRSEQTRVLGSLSKALLVSARGAGRASVLGGRWLTDLLIDTAPRVPLRDQVTLRAQFPGASDEELAEALIAAAAKSTGAVGAAGGALAAVQFTATPSLITTPVQLAAETLLVAVIEMKLIAELHEVYGAGVGGTARQRAMAYLVAWTNRRGIDPLNPAAMQLALGVAAKRGLRKRLIRRAGRNLSTLGPMMTGAIAGSVVNHRETRRVGSEVRADLRR